MNSRILRIFFLLALASLVPAIAFAAPVLFTTNEGGVANGPHRVQYITVYVDGVKKCYTESDGNCTATPDLSSGLHRVDYVWANCNNPDSCPHYGEVTRYINVPEQAATYVVRIPTARVRWYTPGGYQRNGTSVSLNSVHRVYSLYAAGTTNVMSGCYTVSYFSPYATPIPDWPDTLPDIPDEDLKGFERYCFGSQDTYPAPVPDDGNDANPPHVRINVSADYWPISQPRADAGPDQTVHEGAPVVLDGTQSAGGNLTYLWTQISGPAVALSDPESSNPTFTAPAVGPGGATLEFQLIVSSASIESEPDTVVVTVKNFNDPPACQLAQASPALLWPANHKLVPVGIVGVTDPNNGQVTIAITRVTQDEPLNGTGDGDTSPDAVIQGDNVLLRAERSGNGNGRVYRIYFTASDGQAVDRECNGSVTVGVPHSMKKGTTPIDNGQLYDSTKPVGPRKW